jgi:hypothetical protein
MEQLYSHYNNQYSKQIDMNNNNKKNVLSGLLLELSKGQCQAFELLFTKQLRSASNWKLKDVLEAQYKVRDTLIQLMQEVPDDAGFSPKGVMKKEHISQAVEYGIKCFANINSSIKDTDVDSAIKDALFESTVDLVESYKKIFNKTIGFSLS